MSVINQMLKDLEQRNADQGGKVDLMRTLNVRTGRFSIDRQVIKPQILALLGFAALAVAIVLVWKNSNIKAVSFPVQRHAKAEPMVISSLSEEVNRHEVSERNPGQSLVDAKAHLVPVRNIRMAEHHDRFRIVLDFPERIYERVKQIPVDNGRVQYKLRDVYLDTMQHRFFRENVFLKSIHIEDQRNVLTLELTMQEGMISSYNELPIEQSNMYRIVIDIQPMISGGKEPVAISKTLSPKQHQINKKSLTGNKTETEEDVAEIQSGIADHNDGSNIDIKRSVSNQVHASTVYRNALNLLRSGRQEAAITELRRTITLKPALPEALETLSVLLLKTGQIAEAGLILEQSHNINPEHIGFVKLYGRFLVDGGRYTEAEKVLSTAWLRGADDADYLALFAVVAQQLNQHQKAVNAYVKALGINAKQGGWWIGMAISLEALGKKEEARRAYIAAREHGILDEKLLRYAESRMQKLGS